MDDQGLFDALRRGETALTANRRLASHLEEAFGRAERAAGRTAWVSPRILPLSAWLRESFESLWTGEAPLSSAAAALLWEEVIADDLAREGRDLLDVEALAERAAEAHNLLHWYEIDLAGAGSYSEECRAFTRWEKAYGERLRRKGRVDEARLPVLLARAVEAGRFLPAGGAFHLTGFDELLPAHRRLFGALAGRGIESRLLPPRHLPSSPVRFGAPDPESECRAAALFALETLRAAPEARVGIVAANLESYRPLLSRVFTEMLAPEALGLAGRRGAVPFDMSLGPPLIEAPPVHAAMGFLALFGSAAPLEGWRETLLSPYWASGASVNERALFLARLRERRRPRWPAAEIAREAARAAEAGSEGMRAFAAILDKLARLGGEMRGKRSLSAWAESFLAFLKEAGWREASRRTSEEFQAAEALLKQLAVLAALDAVKAEADRAFALERLRRLCRDPHQPETGEAPVLVLGLLETAGLSFDALWFLGAEGESLPAPPRPNPFLPYVAQRETGVRQATPEGQRTHAEALVSRLFGQAPRVTASWPRLREGAGRLMSPLLAALPEEAFPLEPDYAPRAQVRRSGAARAEPFDDPPVPVGEGEEVRGGTFIFSDVAACPFRAFARHRLAAASEKEEEELLDAMEQGKAVHAALHLLFDAYRTRSSLVVAPEAELARTFAAGAERGVAVVERDRGAALPPRLRAVEKARIESVLAAWVERDKERPDFEVVERETARTLVVADLSFQVKADRVDRMADGSEAILDYKSGDPKLPGREGRLTEPQLPLYALTHPEARAVGYALLDGSLCKVKGLSDAGHAPFGGSAPRNPVPWEELVEQWTAELEALAGEFLAGRADLPVTDGACAYCDLAALCRREGAIVDEEGDRAGEGEGP